MNKQYCYISSEGSHKDIGVEELKQIGVNDFLNKDRILVQLDKINYIGRKRVVYSDTHTKCQEILELCLKQEIEDNKSILSK